MEDKQILDLYFCREETALEETRTKYGKRLFTISNNILHSTEDADENVNDTLLKSWNVIPPSRPVMFGAFLAKIARNLSLNKWESKRAAKRGGGEVNIMLGELEECLPAEKSSPEEAHEALIVTDTINIFLSTLDKPTRVAFVLRYFHSENIAAISTRMKMSESKTKSLLHRTRKKLRLHLEKEGIEI